jgi:hypothetical protein
MIHMKVQNHKLLRAYITVRTTWFLQHSTYILCIRDFIVLCGIHNCQSSGKVDFFTSLLCASIILFIVYLIFYAALFITLFIWTQLGSIWEWLLLYSYCMVPTPSWSVGYWWGCISSWSGGLWLGCRRLVHLLLEHAHRMSSEVCRHWLSSVQSGMIQTFPWTGKFLHIIVICNHTLEMIVLVEVFIHW